MEVKTIVQRMVDAVRNHLLAKKFKPETVDMTIRNYLADIEKLSQSIDFNPDLEEVSLKALIKRIDSHFISVLKEYEIFFRDNYPELAVNRYLNSRVFKILSEAEYDYYHLENYPGFEYYTDRIRNLILENEMTPI